VVPRAEEVGELVAIEAPAVRLGEEGHEARDTAGEPDAVDDAGVCGVGDDHSGCMVRLFSSQIWAYGLSL
jgi:hypothetical protein